MINSELDWNIVQQYEIMEQIDLEKNVHGELLEDHPSLKQYLKEKSDNIHAHGTGRLKQMDDFIKNARYIRSEIKKNLFPVQVKAMVDFDRVYSEALTCSIKFMDLKMDAWYRLIENGSEHMLIGSFRSFFAEYKLSGLIKLAYPVRDMVEDSLQTELCLDELNVAAFESIGSLISDSSLRKTYFRILENVPTLNSIKALSSAVREYKAKQFDSIYGC